MGHIINSNLLSNILNLMIEREERRRKKGGKEK